MHATGGDALVVSEEALADANRRGREATGLAVTATGTAGLAGVLQHPVADGAQVAVLFTGRAR